MKDFLQHFTDKITEVYSRLELRQKIVLGALIIMTIGVFVWLLSWSSRTEYGLLFGNIAPKEASKIIDKLDEMKIKYRLTNSGKSIMIPQELVYQTRIKLSSDGTVNQIGMGFEIFDKTSLGMTEFVQGINHQRAMEGELQRTIQSIIGIEYARVHLVFPEDKIFKEDQQDPSASVFLTLKGKLKERQVSGIANLIASAVEGLDASQVTITDQNGNTLTENFGDNIAGLSSFQLKLQNQVETELRNKTQSMLNQILEPGNSVVRVSAELNFDKIESTSESYDPESRVARSEEIQSTKSDMMADSISENSEHLITNYEINKQVQHITSQVGNIKRLTVSVIINHKVNLKEEDGKMVKEYVERTVDELSQIEQQVQNTVGYNSKRGDAIVVSSMRFDDSTREFEKARLEKETQRRELVSLIEKGGVLVVLFVLLFALFSQFKKIFAQTEEEEEEITVRPVLAEGEPDTEGFYPEGEEGMPMGDGKISYSFKPMKDIAIEQTDTQLLQESVRQFVMENPETAVKLIKSWLLDKGQR